MKTTEARLCKHHPNLAKIAIWHPRYHDRRVLISPMRVKEHNIIAFTKSPTLEGLYYVSGKVIRKYPKQSNGTINCHCVPLDVLIPFDWERRCAHEY